MVEKKSCVITFRCLDSRNKRFVEMPCSPDICCYWPAFFDEEVLLRYKTNPDKYSLSDYSFDGLSYCINSNGHVCVLLADLRHLSYKEQLYWKSYEHDHDEKPIPIDVTQEPRQILMSMTTKGFYESQFEGKWDYEESPISIFQHTLIDMFETGCPWWEGGSLELITEGINFPINFEDWRREILDLNKLVVEGIKRSWLTEKLKGLKIHDKEKDGSLKLLEKYLLAIGCQDAKKILDCLFELNTLRNKVSTAHKRDEQEAKKLIDKFVVKHGGYKNHYTYLIKACNETFTKLLGLLREKS